MDALRFMLSVASQPFNQPSNESWKRMEAGFSQGVIPRGLHFQWLKSNPGMAAAEEAEGSSGFGEEIEKAQGFYSIPEATCWLFPSQSSPMPDP